MNTKPSGSITFTPAIDWLTIATYNFVKYTETVAELRRNFPGIWKHARWLQYDGFKHPENPIFYGHALQSNDREHYILKTSGGFANELTRWMLSHTFSDNWYCTRLDVQRTVSTPGWWNVRELHDALKQHRLTTSMIQSETGSTLYLGNRASDRFVRLYEKELITPMLRFEIELKGQYARLAYQLLLEGANVIDIYSENLTALKFPDYITETYQVNGANDINWTIAERIVTMEKKLEWLNTLLPTFAKMANDHDIGSRVRDLFYSLSVPHIDNEHTDRLE